MTASIPRRSFMLGAASAAAMMSVGVKAQTKSAYPSRPVRMVVAFSPGGPIDLATRVVADQLSKKFGQTFVVENRTGANGAIAADLVRAADADGYTMLVSNASMITITPQLKKDLSYDVKRDFAPVSRIASSALILVVNTDNPEMRDIHTVEDLVAAAKAEPGKFSYGSAGPNGNVQQLAFETLKDAADISLLPVPYKGSSEVQAAVLSNTVSLSFDTLTAIPYVKSGKFRALAVSAEQRMSQLPDVPTMVELGYKDFNFGFWSGVFMPKATPPDIVNTVSQAIVEACAKPDVQARLEPYGTVVASTPEDFQKAIDKEIALAAQALKRANVQTQ